MTGATYTLRLPVGSEAGADPKSLVELARRAEHAGFDAVSLSDHVVMGSRVDRYPWGDFPFPPEAPWVEPLTMLTAIAAVTERIRLTTGILIVPLRPAVLLAKWAATLDVVSGGRLELGVGTGWQQEEFDALGVDYRMRGQILTDSIGACRALWRDSPAAYSSPTVSFSETWCEPKPVRGGGPPILFSGTLTARNVRRIVELGDGWIPIMGERRAGIEAGIASLRTALAEAGRPAEDLRVRSAVRIATDVSGRPDLAATIDGAQVLAGIGVNDIDVPLSVFAPDASLFPGFFAAAEKALTGAL